MPTPFYHLNVAQDLLAHPDLPAPVRDILHAERGAFVFGNTAPDVQVVSRQSREATHFFNVPPRLKTPPWEQMQKQYRALADLSVLPAAQAAFLAGYECHLLADFQWILRLFLPFFGPTAGWGKFRHRLYIHNVLRTYLDEQVVPTLTADTVKRFTQAAPQNWLPFVEDNFLVTWRDTIAEQLLPGAVSQTIEVFAERMGLNPDEFSDLLRSEARMESEVFAHISRQELIEYREQLITDSLALLRERLGFLL